MACFPNELIGREIAISGLYEGDILKSSFDVALDDCKERFSKGHCLDVGANIGNHTCFFAKRFAHVLAFEPNPVAFNVLQCNIQLSAPNACAYDFGLSKSEEVLRFGENSSNLGGSGFMTDRDQEDGTFVVKQLLVRRGDEVLAEGEDIPDVAFIKVDVEGHELPVLLGLEKTILKHHPVIAVEMYSSRPDGQEIMKYSKSLGYKSFQSVTKFAGSGRLMRMLSRLQSRVYGVELSEGYEGDHDFVIIR